MLKKTSILTWLLLPLILTSCATEKTSSNTENNSTTSITVYSGRNEKFIKPFFDEFEKNTGIKISARYGDSAELAAQILEEGANSPADVFLSQDAGAIGAIAANDLLSILDSSSTSVVLDKFKDPNSYWVGITGRARVLAYNPILVDETSVPKSIDELTNPKWKSKIGIAPTNSSFQSFVSAMLQVRGEAATLTWLKGLVANDPQVFEKNGQIVEAIDAKVIEVGLVNHYYVYEISKSKGRNIDVVNGYFEAGDVGNLLNVSALGILKTSQNIDPSYQLLDFLLSKESQANFVEQSFEYSLISTVNPPIGMPKLDELQIPNVDLANLYDLKKTQDLLISSGLL